MARLPRLTLAGHPHHLIQRGQSGQPIARGDDDHAQLHALLVDAAREHAVAVHGYVLMPDHFHLLATPPDGQALSALMQTLGRRYVRHFNAATGRRGSLWEGRFRCAVLQADAWVLPCLAYMDLNPVRHALVQQPQDWAWSSHRAHAGHTPDKLVTPHPLYWQLGNTPFAREHAYAQLVQAGLSDAQTRQLTDAGLHGWALGSAPFLAQLQQQTGRRVSRGRAGRPRKPVVVSPNIE